jgi:hypothetical protein
VSTLRALQATANNQGTTAPLTWKALNNADAGFSSPEIDYDRFSARWEDPEEGPILKQLVDRFDGAGLVIKTNTKDQVPKGAHKELEMSRMAKRALHKKRKFD